MAKAKEQFNAGAQAAAIDLAVDAGGGDLSTVLARLDESMETWAEAVERIEGGVGRKAKKAKEGGDGE